MRNCADNDGIPSLSYFIPLYLENYPDYKNYILLTKNFTKPSLSDFSYKTPEIIQGKNIVAIFKTLRKIKPDVIVFHHHFCNPLAHFLLLCSKFLGIKTISQPDINEYGIPRFHRSISLTLKDFLRWILILLHLSLVNKIVVFTKHGIDALSQIKKIPKSKYSIIPWGTKFQIGTEKKENYILTVSKWWEDRKNLHTILRVFSEVIKQKPCKLFIVGKFLKGRYRTQAKEGWQSGEEYEKKIMGLIKDLNLDKYVRFTGVKMGKDLQELYRKAKIYYMPSKGETFGGVFVEAMASGTPVVAMKNSAVQYVVKDGVTGFLRNTEEGQKAAILELLNNEHLYKKMQKSCLEEAKKYKWKEIAKKWKVLIDEVLYEK